MRETKLQLVCAFFVATAMPLVGCADNAHERIETALKQVGAKYVELNEASITAHCQEGDTAILPTTELQRNFLGLSDPEKVVVTARALARACESKDIDKRRAQKQKERLIEAAKTLQVDDPAAGDERVRLAVCDRLALRLPITEPDRTLQAATNTRDWGCQAATRDTAVAKTEPTAPTPTPAPPATTAATEESTPVTWTVALAPKTAKKKIHTAQVKNQDGDSLMLRCNATSKKAAPEWLVELAQNDGLKKGTRALLAAVDDKKPAKWMVKPLKQGLMLKPARGLPAFRGGKDVAFVVPTKSGKRSVAFSLSGVEDAVKQLPAGCRKL